MILHNKNYVEQGYGAATEENAHMRERDKSWWFYRRWSKLLEIRAGDEWKKELEDRLESHLKYMKDLYRVSYEKGIISYPTAVAFASYKEKMEGGHTRDEVYETLMGVFRRLPKCGLLHVHSAAALSAEGLIALLKEWKEPAIFIETAGESAGKMAYLKPGEVPQSETFMPLQVFFAYVGAEQKLKEWLTIGPHTDQIPYIWDEFNRIFVRTSDLFDDKVFYFEYHRRFFLECLRDRIDYVELRCGFQNFPINEGSKQDDIILDQSPEFLDVLIEAKNAAVECYRENEKSFGWKLPFTDLGLGVILCARRDLDTDAKQDKEKLMKKIDTAIVWKQGKYKNLIKGFDFVSEEDRGRASYTYYKDIFYGTALSGYTEGSNEERTFEELRGKYGIGAVPRVNLIELMLHAGESLWMERENIIDAKIASKNRIGHGFQLLEYPGALCEYRVELADSMMSGPVLEVCPISNQMLRYFPDVRNHYALMLMKMGVPCVLANDDPQILGNPGISYDFWEMYMAADGGLMMIKGLVFTAFLFQYQDRIGKSMQQWEEKDYNACLHIFEVKYWIPYLREMRDYFGDPKEEADGGEV